jgi:tetratricopeptide (TPR) repeat protein
MAAIKLDDTNDSVKALFDKGVEAQERNNLDYAMDMFEAVLLQEPALLEARKRLRESAFKSAGSCKPLTGIKLAAVLLKLNSRVRKKPEEALGEIEKLLRTDPSNIKLTLLQCDAAQACNMPEVSLMSLGLLNQHVEGDLSILEPLADLSCEAELYDQEYECRDQIAKIKPGDSTALKQLKDAAARLTMGKSGWQDAASYRELTRQPASGTTQGSDLDQLIRKVSDQPDNLTLSMDLADAYARNRQFDEALDSLQRFQTRSGSNHIDLDQKILKISEQKLSMKLAEAEDQQDEGLISDLRQQLKELQITSAAQLAERYPTDLQLKYDYGKRLFEDGQFTEAIQQFQQAKENLQRRSQALQYLAKAFKEKGQPEIAAEHFLEALKELPHMNDNRKDVLYELGLLCEQAGQIEQARMYLKEIYAADIGYRDVATRVENIADQS